MLIEPYLLDTPHPALAPATSALRRAIALTLHRASNSLQRLALQLTRAPARSATCGQPPVLEFYAEAGAPEGALYVDGRLVARLPGVQRL